MSKHKYETSYKGRPVVVFMGWTRHQQGHFMRVERLDVCKEDISFSLFSNLDEDVHFPKTLDTYILVLENLGISVPMAMLEDVQQDRIENIGQKYIDWTGTQ